MNGMGNTELTVFQKQLQMVYRIAYTYLGSRTDAENASQEVFVRLFRSGVELEDMHAVKGWLASKVTEVCLKRINDPAFSPAEDTDGHKIDDTMAAIMSLPGKYKTVAYLFYYEELTAAETAELMGDELEVTRSIIGRLHRTMSAKLAGESGDYESAYDRIRIDANSAVNIWKNILSIQSAIDDMLEKQGGAARAAEKAPERTPERRASGFVPVTTWDDEDDEDETVTPEIAELFTPEPEEPLWTDRMGDDNDGIALEDDDNDVRIFTPRGEETAAEPETAEQAQTEEYEFFDREIKLESDLEPESFDWDEIRAETETEDGGAENAAHGEEEYEPMEDETQPEPKKTGGRHGSGRRTAGKKRRGSVIIPIVVGAAIVIASAILLVNLFKDKLPDGHGVLGSAGEPQLGASNPAISVPVVTEAPIVYEGSGDGVKKVRNVQGALEEWNAYKSAERRKYLEAELPSFIDFVERTSYFDGTDVVENGDGTYSFIHWIYDEDWGNTTISAITGEEEPTLTQRFDFEHSVTVEEDEYNRYMEYLASEEGSYGDFHYSYGVKNAADGEKLSEIAQKHSLSLRLDNGESKGYGEISDQALADELASRACSGPLYSVTPQIDYINFYNSGAFEAMAEIRLEDGRRMYTLLCSAPYTEMIDAAAAGGVSAQNRKSMSERSYKSADGTKLSIVQNEDQAIVYAYLDNCYAVLDLSINAWREAPDMADTEQERLAKRETDLRLSDAAVNFVCDSINFANIGK